MSIFISNSKEKDALHLDDMFQISFDILLERLSKRPTIEEEKKRKSKGRETHKRNKNFFTQPKFS